MTKWWESHKNTQTCEKKVTKSGKKKQLMKNVTNVRKRGKKSQNNAKETQTCKKKSQKVID